MTKWVVSEDAAAPAALAAVAQLVERVLGKDEVTGPSPVSSSERFLNLRIVACGRD